MVLQAWTGISEMYGANCSHYRPHDLMSIAVGRAKFQTAAEINSA